MAGIFGVVSSEDCIKDLYLGTFYLQHRAQDYCGIAFFDGENLQNFTHAGLIKQQFPKERLKNFKGNYGIGSVSVTREPVSEFSKSGGGVMTFDGNLINNPELKEKLLRAGISFSGYHNPEEVNDSVLISSIIARGINFEKGIEELVNTVQGDFAVICLKKEGIYAARGWGRKPLILGQKDGSYSVSSESTSFVNTNFRIVRDVEPGEIVFLDKEGIHEIKKLSISPIKYGTFEWIYTAYPTSIIDGKNVKQVRKSVGGLLAKRYPVEADIVSPIPNSGRWHAKGYSEVSGILYDEVFLRYDYSDRSYTPSEQLTREDEAKIKLIPDEYSIKNKRIITVDDSIVRGNQTKEQTKKLKESGAKEVHGRIACPPLMSPCRYGKSTRNAKECIARVMSIEEIKESRRFDSLGYATIEDLEKAIGFPKEKLCLECWDF